MTIDHYLDYREYLRDVLEKRIRENRAYSARAFARDLKLSPQTLNFLIHKKRKLSLTKAIGVVDRLGLSYSDRKSFLELVAKTQIGATELAEQSNPVDQVYEQLQADAFEVIAEWHHYAIFELSGTKGFKSSKSWIAARLGVTAFEVDQALARLLRLKMIERTSSGYRKTYESVTTTNEVPSQAIKSFNKQILKKAIVAVDQQDLKTRDMTTITMAINTKKIPEAKLMIKNFRRQMSKLLEVDSKNEVYCLAIQLFSLTETKENS